MKQDVIQRLNSLFDETSVTIANDWAKAYMINHGGAYHDALKYFNYGVFSGGNETKGNITNI